MSLLSSRWICMLSSGVRNSLSPLTGDANFSMRGIVAEPLRWPPRAAPELLMELARIRLAASLVASLILASCGAQAPAPATRDAAMLRIDTVVVIYAENHSFDNLYGLFPGADGIANATPEQATQIDHDGTPLKELITFGSDGRPDPSFPRMPNKPFRIDAPPVSRTLD